MKEKVDSVLSVAMASICSESLVLRSDETLLIVADTPRETLADGMCRAARGLGYGCETALVGTVHRAGQAPEGFTRELLGRYRAALLVTSRSLSHTDVRRWACREAGSRIASLPALTLDMLGRLFPPGALSALAGRVERAAGRLEGVTGVRVRTPRGTDISFSVLGRKVYRDTGIYDRPGRFGNLPAGEICVAPVEGSAEGVLVVDVAFAGIGRVTGLSLEIVAGRIESACGRGSRRLLQLLREPEHRVLGEFGIGVNPLARPGPITLEAEKAVGTVHFGFGDNRSFGGFNAAGGHWDAVLLCDEIETDGCGLSFST